MRLQLRPMTHWLVCAGMCAGAAAVDESSPNGMWDLRLIVDSMPSYKVREDATSAVGTSTYEWQGLDRNRTWQPELELLRANGLGGPEKGTLIYGLRLSGGGQTSTPAAYSSAGVTYTNTTHQTMGWYRLAGGAVLGWQSSPLQIDELRLVGELSAYGEAGVMHLTVSDDTVSGSDWGTTTEYGLRAGAFISERSWYGGVLANVLEGWGNAKAPSFGGTANSEFHLHRNGVAVGAIMGYRF